MENENPACEARPLYFRGRGGLDFSSASLALCEGSRDEDLSNLGVTQMLQTMAFHSTAHLSFLRTVKTIEVLGASAGCVAGRSVRGVAGEERSLFFRRRRKGFSRLCLFAQRAHRLLGRVSAPPCAPVGSHADGKRLVSPLSSVGD